MTARVVWVKSRVRGHRGTPMIVYDVQGSVREPLTVPAAERLARDLLAAVAEARRGKSDG